MTAPEPTPLERAAEAGYLAHPILARDSGSPDTDVPMPFGATPDVIQEWHHAEARAAVTALLEGDWLERVLVEHEWVGMLDECACGWDEGFRPKKRHPAHLAAAVRAAAGVGL